MKLKKKNFALFVSVISLLLMAYIFDEIPQQKAQEKEMNEGKLFDSKELGDIQAIEGKDFWLQKNAASEKESWSFKNKEIPVSNERVNLWLEILTHYKVKNVVAQGERNTWPSSPEHFIPKDAPQITFYFQGGQVQFKLGHKLEYGQEFYMLIRPQSSKDKKPTLAVIYDTAPEEGVYKEQDQRLSESRWLKMKDLFLAHNSAFMDLAPFREEQLASWHKIKKLKIKNYRFPSFEIDLKEGQTLPKAPETREFRPDVAFNHLESLLKIKAQEVFAPPTQKLLQDKIGEVKLVNEKNEEATIKVFRRYGKLDGPFLVSSLNPYMYQLKAEDTQNFTMSVEEFWERRLAKEAPQRIRLEFPREGKSADVVFSREGAQVINMKPKANIQKWHIKQEAFNHLAEWIGENAQKISRLKDNGPERRPDMGLSIDGKEYDLFKDKGEIKAIDRKGHIELDYFSLALPKLGVKWDDYFVKEKVAQERINENTHL